MSLLDYLICQPRRYHYEICFCSGEIINVSGMEGRYYDRDSNILILYCHGNKRSICSLSYVVEFLDFCDVIVFDYHGFGTSDNCDNCYSPGSLVDDTLQMIDYCRHRFPEKKLVVYGHSLGGAIAIQACSHRKVDGLILEGTFSSLEEIVLFPRLLSYFLGLNEKYPSYRYIEKVKCSLLYAHSIDDDQIPHSESEKLCSLVSGVICYLRGSHNRPIYSGTYRSVLQEFLASI